MTIDPESVIRPARRFAATFTWGLWLLAGLAVAVSAAFVIAPLSTARLLAAIAGHPVAMPRAWQCVGLVLLCLVQLGVWARVLMAGRAVCRALVIGALDGAGAAAQRLSAWLWVLLGWSALGQLLVSPVATWHLAEGERQVAVAFGSAQFSAALAAIVAALLARGLVIGAQLWQDHREIV